MHTNAEKGYLHIHIQMSMWKKRFSPNLIGTGTIIEKNRTSHFAYGNRTKIALDIKLRGKTDQFVSLGISNKTVHLIFTSPDLFIFMSTGSLEMLL